MSHNNNPWKTAADQTIGVEGVHIKCSRGIWSADGTPLETGPDGARIVVIMPTARIGIVKWQDGRLIDTNIGCIEDGFVLPEAPDDSWNQYTEVLCVFTDGKRRGAPGTFTSSSWAGRFAFWKLVKPYARTGAFPICTLSTKARRDINGNIDPVFVISGWASPSDFPGYTPLQQIGAPETAPQIEHTRAELIDDEIPF